MKKLPLFLIGAGFYVAAMPLFAEIHVLDNQTTEQLIRHLYQMDFENLPIEGSSCPDIFTFPTPLDNPLDLGRIVVTGECLASGFCTPETCEPDSDNPYGPGVGNIELILNQATTIDFRKRPRLTVLDIQGIGDASFELIVRDTAGNALTVTGTGVLYGKRLVGLYAPAGVQQIEIIDGSSGGPFVLASIYLPGGRGPGLHP